MKKKGFIRVVCIFLIILLALFGLFLSIDSDSRLTEIGNVGFNALTGQAIAPPLECTDSDGGIIYDVQGSACVSGPSHESIQCLTDVCNGNILTEYYCENGMRKVIDDHVCDFMCDEGACLPGFDFFDDHDVDVGDNSNIDALSIDRVEWDGGSSYLPSSGGARISNDDEGLVALWHFDEDPREGLDWDDPSGVFYGNAEDSSGNGNNGSCFIDLIFQEGDCPYNEADIHKIGKSSDYFPQYEAAQFKAGKFDIYGNELTIAGWINFYDYAYYSEYAIIVGKQQTYPVYLWGLKIIEEQGNNLLVFELKTDDGLPSEILVGEDSSNGWIIEDEWVHVAAVYDGTTMVVYKNGVNIGTVEKTGNVAIDDSKDVLISKYTFGGLLDELAIWDTALTSQEIEDISQVDGGERGIANSFRSNLIDVGGNYYDVFATWEEIGEGANVQISTDGGSDWCHIENGKDLNDSHCSFPATEFLYRVIFTDDSYLDNVAFNWDVISQCNDGVDNDEDSAIDWPDDFSCENEFDDDETNPTAQCQDGLDNDGDGWFDWPDDPGCESNQDDDEMNGNLGECADNIDNDGDRYLDGYDPKCETWETPTEFAQCQDGLDNDQDGDMDYLEDYGCFGPNDDNEVPEAEFLLDSCGVELDVPGTYILQENLNTDGTCFTITSDNVIIYGNDFSITGDDGIEDYGVYAKDVGNIAVKNLKVNHFGGTTGSEEIGGGITFISVNYSSIIRTQVSDNDDNGIYMGKSCDNVVQENVISSHTPGYYYGVGLFVDYHSEGSICVNSSGKNQILDNTFTNNDYGMHMMGGENHFVKGNEANSNKFIGLRVTADDAEIIDNVAELNQYLDGIFVSGDNNFIKNNLAKQNVGRDGISVSGDGNTIVDNVAFWNENGIVVSSPKDNIIIGNDASSNFVNGLDISFGYFGDDSNVVISDNVFNDNIFDGIHISATSPSEHRNLIQNNEITGNQGNGIYFKESHENLIINNIIKNSGDSGIQFSGAAHNLIQDNFIDFNNPNGIYLTEESDNNTITGGSLEGSGEVGVMVADSNENRVVGIDIVNSDPNADAIILSGDSLDNEFIDVVVTGTDPEEGYDIVLQNEGLDGTSLVNTYLGSYFIEGSGYGGSKMLFSNSDGVIEFLSPIYGVGNNLDEDVKVLYGIAAVDSEYVPGFDKHARISLNNLPLYDVPRILRDGEECGQGICTLINFDEGDAIFDVTGWTEYSIEESSCPDCPACSNFEDDDGDGWNDAEDPGCWAEQGNPDSYDPEDDDESYAGSTECSDEFDNEGDGLVDGYDPMCYSWDDDREMAQCQDGLDNDADGHFDFPDDPGCVDENDDLEDDGIPLGDCATIDQQGVYYLINDISTDGTCFNIEVDDVVLDGQGFSIIGDGENGDYGLYANGVINLDIRNLGIENFDYGIKFEVVNYSLFDNLDLNHNDDYGIWFTNSSHNIIQRSTLIDNLKGIYLSLSSHGNLIRDNVMIYNLGAYGNGYGMIIRGSNDNQIVDNVVNSNDNGIYLDLSSENNLVKGNDVNLNEEEGIFISTGSNNIVKNNDLIGNVQKGIYIRGSSFGNSTNNLVSGNLISSSEYGIYVEGALDNVFESNTLNLNEKGIFMISDSANNRFVGSEISNSGLAGILFWTSSPRNNSFLDVIVQDTHGDGFDIVTNEAGIEGVHLINTYLARYNIVGNETSGEGALMSFSESDGKIEFLEQIYGAGEDLSNDVGIDYNLANVDSEDAPDFNKTARIRLEGLPAFSDPVVLRNGVECPSEICTLISFEDGIGIFEVTGWTDYSIGESGASPLPPESGEEESKRLPSSKNIIGDVNAFKEKIAEVKENEVGEETTEIVRDVEIESKGLNEKPRSVSVVARETAEITDVMGTENVRLSPSDGSDSLFDRIKAFFGFGDVYLSDTGKGGCFDSCEDETSMPYCKYCCSGKGWSCCFADCIKDDPSDIDNTVKCADKCDSETDDCRIDCHKFFECKKYASASPKGGGGYPPTGTTPETCRGCCEKAKKWCTKGCYPPPQGTVGACVANCKDGYNHCITKMCGEMLPRW